MVQNWVNVACIVTSITDTQQTLRSRELRDSLHHTLTLTVVNFAGTVAVVSGLGIAFFALPPTTGFLLGVIVGSTSPAVIVPLVRQLRFANGARTVLILESAVSDVLSIVATIAFLETLHRGGFHLGVVTGAILASFTLATAIGAATAFLWSVLLNRLRTLQNSIFTTPAFVFVVFGVVELLGYSGYIAALAFGVTLGNIERFNLPFLRRFIPEEPIALNETERSFFSEVVFLLKTFFFVYVGISIRLNDIFPVATGLALSAAILLWRIPAVRFTMRKGLNKRDAGLMAAISPKGLAAAALASLPLQQGIVNGELIQNVAYAVVLFSIVLTSVLIFLQHATGLSKVYQFVFRGLPDKEDS